MNYSRLTIIIGMNDGGTEDGTLGGQYKLQLTTQYGTGALLKTPRTVVFDKILTVS